MPPKTINKINEEYYEYKRFFQKHPPWSFRDHDDGRAQWAIFHCYQSAVWNRTYIYNRLHLSLCVGSIGVGQAHNIIWMFGNSAFKTASEFKTKTTAKDKRMSVHVWLEDKDQNVYDMAYDFYAVTARATHRPYTIPPNTLLYGCTVHDLAASGLHYRRASASVTNEILLYFKSLNCVPQRRLDWRKSRKNNTVSKTQLKSHRRFTRFNPPPSIPSHQTDNSSSVIIVFIVLCGVLYLCIWDSTSTQSDLRSCTDIAPYKKRQFKRHKPA
jgi:hypothetical protein